MPNQNAGWLSVATEVQQALDQDRPVVALESTVIAHGLPYPENIQTARAMETVVRENGAVPATIAILDGIPRVGLSDDDLEVLATSEQVRKVSRRDLPVVIAEQAHGATTVATTMFLAAAAGIEVFATGGIGGVHRQHPFDVSADLPELTQTPVVVVCAGAKAILDLPLTLEWLETHGVPVLGYKTDSLPAFYTFSSGLPVDTRVENADQVARIVRAQRRLGLPGGILVTVPPPRKQAVPRDVIESAIETALQEAAAEGVRGRETTPYLLARIAELTHGESLQANIALLRNNSIVAAQIAASLT